MRVCSLATQQKSGGTLARTAAKGNQIALGEENE
jgi:hypothetical protein